MFDWLYGPILAAKADRLGTYAAALGYCLVLSLIPFLVVTFVLGTELAPTKLDLASAYGDLLKDILPGDDLGLNSEKNSELGQQQESEFQVAPKYEKRPSRTDRIIKTLQDSSHRHWAVVGYLLAVYTSFNLMTQIVRTLLFIFDDPRRAHEWNWGVVFKTLSLFVIWMLLLLLLAAFSIATPVIESILNQLHLNPDLWKAPLLAMRNLVGLVAVFGAFFLTFFLVSSKKYKLSQVRDGSLVATLGWVLCSFVFAKILPSMWSTNAVYEALGSIVIILIWAQACAWSVIIGACWMVRFPGAGRRSKS